MPQGKTQSKNSESGSKMSSNGSLGSKPLPRARTTEEQERYEMVTQRNLALQTKVGPAPAIYGGPT